MKRFLIAFISLGTLGILAYFSGFLYTDSQYEKRNEAVEQEEFLKAEEHNLVQKEEIVNEIHVQETKEVDMELKETSASDAITSSFVEPDENVRYYLIEEFGFVNIYLQDKTTIYEFTDIKIGELPQELQDEICTGKGLASEQELYDFLENYSS